MGENNSEYITEDSQARFFLYYNTWEQDRCILLNQHVVHTAKSKKVALGIGHWALGIWAYGTIQWFAWMTIKQ